MTDGGSIILKIHPGTYLIILAFLSHLAGQTRPNAAVWTLCGGAANLALYLVAIATCLTDMLLTTGIGNMIVLIDTFLPAGLLACVLADANDDNLRVTRRVLQFGVCINAILALGGGGCRARRWCHSILPVLLLTQQRTSSGQRLYMIIRSQAE